MLVPGTISKENTATYIPAHVDLIRRLSEQFDITIFSTVKPDGDSAPYICGKAKVQYISARFDDHLLKQMYAFVRSFQRAHGQERFDATHGFRAIPSGICAVLLGMRWQIPSIVSLQGGEVVSLPDIDYGNLRKQPLRGMTLWTCRQATALTVLTHFQQRLLEHVDSSGNDLRVIPYAAQNQFYTIYEEKKILPPYRFIHVGQLNRIKDQHTLLKAFQHISHSVDARLRIIGNDLLKGQLHQFASALGIAEKVEFVGFVRHDKLPEHYQWAHCMLHTSLYEGEAVVIAEAAASGVLICGTNVGLIADITPDAAFSVTVGDDVELANGVLNLITDPIQYSSLQQSARKWATVHTAEWTFNRFCSLYDNILR